MPTLEEFAAHLNTFFETSSNTNGRHKLELIEASPSSKAIAPQETKSFTLLFRYTADRPLTQNIYNLNHNTLGNTAVFLVPLAPDEEYDYAEAIFN